MRKLAAYVFGISFALVVALTTAHFVRDGLAHATAAMFPTQQEAR